MSLPITPPHDLMRNDYGYEDGDEDVYRLEGRNDGRKRR